MSTSYDIASRLRAIADEIEAAEGVIPDALDDEIQALSGDAWSKLYGLRLWYTEEAASAARWKAEAAHCKREQQRAERRAGLARMFARWLVESLDAAGEDIPKGIVRRTVSVDLTVSPTALPEQYQKRVERTSTTTTADKTAIKAALEKGLPVPGARLVIGFASPPKE